MNLVVSAIKCIRYLRQGYRSTNKFSEIFRHSLVLYMIRSLYKPTGISISRWVWLANHLLNIPLSIKKIDISNNGPIIRALLPMAQILFVSLYSLEHVCRKKMVSKLTKSNWNPNSQVTFLTVDTTQERGHYTSSYTWGENKPWAFCKVYREQRLQAGKVSKRLPLY